MPAPGQQHVGNGSNPAISNPFVEARPRMSEYTAAEIATLQSRLERKLGPEYLSSRPGPGGAKIHYVTAEKCIQLANEVFGFNGWSSQIVQVQVDYADEHPTTSKIDVGLSVILRVTLRDGTFHEDIGYGHIENCKGKAAAFEKAKKEGTTDALKRALRHFGNVLGNCIYDKEYLSKVTKIKVKPSKWDVEALHRHSDYAPVKREPGPVDGVQPNNIPDLVTRESIDDEFGDFDEADFSTSDPNSHPDEVVLYEAPTLPTNFTNATKRQSGNSSSTFSSMAAPAKPHAVQANTTAGRPQHTVPQVNNQQPRPSVPGLIPPKTPNAGFTRSHSAQTQHHDYVEPNTNVVRVQPPNGPAQVRKLNQPSRSGIQNMSAPPSPGHLIKPGDFNEDDEDLLSLPSGVPMAGFFSAKAAQILPEGQDAPAIMPANAPTFNPHLDSPSIRRTPGVDHKSSKPLSRNLKPVPSSQVSGAPAALRTNVVNPQLENTRRIGAPGSPSPMANRNSYKPPTITKRPIDSGAVKRPPLGELQDNGPVGGEVKRQKKE